MKTYSIRKSSLKKGLLYGFEVKDEGRVTGIQGEIDHMIVLMPIDGIKEDTKWGRLKFDIELPELSYYRVYAFASNVKENLFGEEFGDPIELLKKKNNEERINFLEKEKWSSFINMNDLLLFSGQGRYLWLVFQVESQGEPSISNIKVEIPEDDFLNFFPEIYRDWDSFFHRYLSIYYSLYQDLQTECENTGKLFDPDTAPKELLPVFAEWMGLDLEGNVLPENVMRTLVKEAYNLNKMKGTRWSIERITQIVLDRTPTIVENNLLREKNDNSVIYGETRYDISIIIRRDIEEDEKMSFASLLKQFIPVRCKLHVFFLREQGILDNYTYMDLNSKIDETSYLELDEKQGMDHGVVLAQ